jgi:predicted phosphodiesterase
VTAYPPVDPLAAPAKLAFAGDWHGQARYAERAIAVASHLGATTLIHTGDFAYSFDYAFLSVVTEALTEHGMVLLFADGNHEDFDKLYSWPIGENGLRRVSARVYHLPRGFRWRWAGVSFIAVGGAHSVDRKYRQPHVSWWPDETLTAGDVIRCTTGGVVDVMVSHDCPAGVDIPGLSPEMFDPHEIERSEKHRETLRAIVDEIQPLRVVHGHYHVEYDTTADLGYGPVQVTGLDCDGSPMGANLRVFELGQLDSRWKRISAAMSVGSDPERQARFLRGEQPDAD